MMTRVDTLIVGAGQAGLTLSHHLRGLGVEHLVLERGRVAERWRSERWDSFRLLSPNWQTAMPGSPYRGDDPDGFMGKADVIAMFERYAQAIDAPVRTGVAVLRVRPVRVGWSVSTDRGELTAANVVVATGHHQQPRIPMAYATRLPADVVQLHTSHYRNPAQLPDGGVLVVGAGPSGQQIAEELADSGRRVVLAAGRHRTLPRRYRGHDANWWMERMGAFERTVDSLRDPLVVRRAPAFVLGAGHETLDLRRLVAHGVQPAGRLTGISGSTAWFADDLPETVARADANVLAFRAGVDDHVRCAGLVVPPADDPPEAPGRWVRQAPRLLHLDHAGIRAVVWATGYRRDFSWIDAPVLDASGEPLQRRGVTMAPGLYFLGLRWMHRRGSDTIHGVGRDAAYLAEAIARRTALLTAAA